MMQATDFGSRHGDERSSARPEVLPAARAELTTVLAGMVLACAPSMEGC